MNASNTRTTQVWVNAGEKAVTFTRVDKKEWDKALFVSVPNGVRGALVRKLAKVDGKATMNIKWAMPNTMLETRVTETGYNAGKEYYSVTITEEFLEEWLNQHLEVTKRGAVSPKVQSILDAWETVPADDNFDLSSLTEEDDF